MPAVSNSSPLILSSAIGRFELLREVYGEIVIPPAVWHEVVEIGADRPGASEIERAAWITRRSMAALDTRSLGTSKLDRGEAEAIALAVSLGPGTSILLDDLRARTAAERLGLRVTGSAGVLTEAKRLEIIPAVRPILDELQDAGLYLDRRAVSVMLEEVGE